MKRRLLAATIIWLMAAWSTLAQGEHGRRVAAELLILRGDAKLLIGVPALSTQHKTGLQERLRGGLSGLAILMRLADQEKAATPQDVQSIVVKLRAALHQSNFEGFQSHLSDLIGSYSLEVTGILPATATPFRLKRARQVHETVCAGCHDDPDKDVERPAYNLFKQAGRISLLEFTARMIIGVRGDRVTGISNPFTDEEIASLIAYYRADNLQP